MVAKDDSGELTRLIARKALSLGGFPAAARERALSGIVDAIGCMVAGQGEPVARPLLATITQRAREPDHPAMLVGTAKYATAADAALYNGTMAHALDFDDTSRPALTHPSCVLAPALFAAAAHSGASGERLVSAYVVGLEVMGRLGMALNPEHYKRGWHTTSTLGSVAGAVAAGLLLDLSEEQLLSAIGIAASAASGLRANFGSMVKPLHAGYAARNAILSALLARNGMVASGDSLEHRCGFLHTFNDGIRCDTAPLLAFGSPLAIMEPYGLGLKFYPSCGATQPGVEAAILLHPRIAGRAIRSVRLGVCEQTFEPLIYVMPEEPLQGKFSMHFCVALGLLRGELTLRSFSEHNVRDLQVRGLIERISMSVDERWRKAPQHPTEITVELEDGTTLTEFVEVAIGNPTRSLSIAQQKQKFEDCAGGLLAQGRGAAAFDTLMGLDSKEPACAVLERALPAGR